MPLQATRANGKATTGCGRSTRKVAARRPDCPASWPGSRSRGSPSEQRGLPIEERHELDEGASLRETLALLRELGDDAVLCTQGDVLENLFGESGQKGSTRIVELQNGEPAVLDYLPPPA
jgi:hypothetical protein